MLSWVWYEGKKANLEKLAGHKGDLSSSCQEMVQDSAFGEPVAHHRVFLQWHILASAYTSIIKKSKTNQPQNWNTAFPHTHLELFFITIISREGFQKNLLCT